MLGSFDSNCGIDYHKNVIFVTFSLKIKKKLWWSNVSNQFAELKGINVKVIIV